MDSRSTKRDARRAARDLLAARTDLVAELAVRHNDLQTARATLAQAQSRLDDTEKAYRAARASATTGGWNTDELLTLGYPSLRQPHRRLATSENRTDTADGHLAEARSGEPLDDERPPAT